MLNSSEDMYLLHQQQLKTRAFDDSVLIGSIKNEKNIFEEKLNQEANNITEPGEAELVKQLHKDYKDYQDTYLELKSEKSLNEDDFSQLYQDYVSLRSGITEVYNMNMFAIQKKSNDLQKIAGEITIYMSVVATASILIALFFILSFPSKIVGPIKELTEKIKSISERNYDQKLEISSKDELGELASAFNNMADRLKLYQAKHIDQLLSEQRRMEALVHNLDDGVLLIDENKKVVLANKTILDITGLKETDIVSHYMPDIAAQNDLMREVYKYTLNLDKENNSVKPLRIVFNNEELFYNIEKEEIKTYSELSHQETFIGYLILLKNITQFQARDTAKTNLLATVSHELKTPLSSINLSLKLLDDKRVGSLNEEQKEVINSLRQQSNRLSRVINELLDYSQIETGNIKLRFSPANPEDVIDLGVTALMLQLSEKNINLETEIEDNLPSINADVEKTVFVLVNLLSNAIRFSKENDKIKIKVNRQKNEIYFSVVDNGPGIPKNQQEKLFERFTNIGDKSKRGWGLGLAIAKEFVQAQNGRIWVESEVGEGSNFIFTLPVG